MLMIPARLVRSESFWAVVKVRSPHTGPEVCYIIRDRDRACGKARGWRKERDPPSALHGAIVSTLPGPASRAARDSVPPC